MVQEGWKAHWPGLGLMTIGNTDYAGKSLPHCSGCTEMLFSG